MNNKEAPVLFDSLREKIENAISDVVEKESILDAIEELKNQTRDTALLLDQLPIGIVIVDVNARALHINRYAREVLEAGDGLSLVDSCLKGDKPEVTSLLSNKIASAITEDVGIKHALSVARPSGAPALGIVIASASRGSAVVFIGDSERQSTSHHALISELYGLTPMEGLIAGSIVRGQRLTDIAGQLNISVNTARSHLRQVFAKTGTTRQLDLANLIGKLLGSVWLGEDSNPTEVVDLSQMKR